jgi:hypothetical protein
MVALMAVLAVLLSIGGNSVWNAITHVGPGVWTVGGDEAGTVGQLGTGEHQDVIPGSQYKRECYATAALSFFLGGIVLWNVVKKWKERDELEKSWERMISNPDDIEDIHMHPENYRDDFKQWIKENHPHLAFWNLPPNS